MLIPFALFSFTAAAPDSIIHRGKVPKIEVDIKANQDTEKASYKVFAKIAGIDIEVVSGDACKNMKCPTSHT